MAGTSNDPITREWWLLAYVLEFVMATGRLTPPEAESLLLDYANTGWFDDFQWHETGAQVVFDLLDALPSASPSLPPGPVRPRQWGLRDHSFGTEVLVEWPHSRVVHRLASPAPFASARELHDLLVPFGAPPDGHTMHLVRLRGVDVISMLRHAGLISREQETALLCAAGFLSFEPAAASAETVVAETVKSDETESKDEASDDTEPEHVKYGMPAPKSPDQKTIQAFVIKTWGLKWRDVTVSTMRDTGYKDAEFRKLFSPFPERTKWRRALGLKKD
jgi:hypothetical protein